MGTNEGGAARGARRRRDVLLYVVDKHAAANMNGIWVRRWRWLVARLLRARGNTTLPLPGELLPTRCFGPLADAQQLALEGLAGRDTGPTPPPARGAPDDAPAP
jgi:hypothetical protein